MAQSLRTLINDGEARLHADAKLMDSHYHDLVKWRGHEMFKLLPDSCWAALGLNESRVRPAWRNEDDVYVERPLLRHDRLVATLVFVFGHPGLRVWWYTPDLDPRPVDFLQLARVPDSNYECFVRWLAQHVAQLDRPEEVY